MEWSRRPSHIIRRLKVTQIIEPMGHQSERVGRLQVTYWLIASFSIKLR